MKHNETKFDMSAGIVTLDLNALLLVAQVAARETGENIRKTLDYISELNLKNVHAMVDKNDEEYHRTASYQSTRARTIVREAEEFAIAIQAVHHLQQAIERESVKIERESKMK